MLKLELLDSFLGIWYKDSHNGLEHHIIQLTAIAFTGYYDKIMSTIVNNEDDEVVVKVVLEEKPLELEKNIKL